MDFFFYLVEGFGDFPGDLAGLFVFAETEEGGGLPYAAGFGPGGKFKIGDELGFDPMDGGAFGIEDLVDEGGMIDFQGLQLL